MSLIALKILLIVFNLSMITILVVSILNGAVAAVIFFGSIAMSSVFMTSMLWESFDE